MLVRRFVPLGVLAACWCGARTAAAQAPATLHGVVVAAESGERIAYAVVVLQPGFTQQFADETGGFLFAGVGPGEHRLLVRQVGYAPFDTVLAISGATPALRLELHHLPVELAAMSVSAWGECRSPEPPDSTADQELVRVFDQLRVNAERYRLLADAYPFKYRLIRRFTTYLRGGGESSENSVVEQRSDDRWRYAPGRVVMDNPEDRNIRMLHLPILPDLADSAFHRTHCFRLAGMDSVEGHAYLRVEFRVAKSQRQQDIDGAVFLDPETYQVRHTTVSLTRPDPGIRSLVANTAFKEIAPNIWVIDRVSAMTTLERGPGPVIGRTEEQKLMSVEFVRPLPSARDSVRP